VSGLKRFAFLLIFTSMLVMGCTTASDRTFEIISQEEEPASEPVTTVESVTTVEPVTTKEPVPAGELSPKPKDVPEQVEQKKLLLDQEFLPRLARNESNGFDVSIGMTKDDVIAKYGQVTRVEVYEGGIYYAFEKLPEGIFYFDNKNRVYAIHLSATHLSETNLMKIIDALGPPVEQGESLVDGDYTLFYKAGDNEVFISAESSEASVDKIRIINKKMLNDCRSC